MNKHPFFPRILALLLSDGFVAPLSVHALRPAGVEDPSARADLGDALSAGAEEKSARRRKWTVEKVVEVIGRAAASKRPKLSLAPGAIQSESQRRSVLGAELYRAYAAVVINKSFPEDLSDWPAALRAAGEDPADHYRRVSAGMEEIRLRGPMAVVAEAIQGPAVVVIDGAIFPDQAGLEEFLARLPAEGRFIVVGAGSAAGLEARARNPNLLLAADSQEAAVAVLALGVPEEVLRQIDWTSVESALSSLEAA